MEYTSRPTVGANSTPKPQHKFNTSTQRRKGRKERQERKNECEWKADTRDVAREFPLYPLFSFATFAAFAPLR
jgi:hypothetical protein